MWRAITLSFRRTSQRSTAMKPPSTPFRLDPKQRQQVRHRARNERDHRITRRLLALLWLDQGRTETEVAQLLGVEPRSIRNWKKLYRTGGLDALCTLQHKGDRGERTGPQQQQLRDEILHRRRPSGVGAGVVIHVLVSLDRKPAR